jgi:uncharacterized protein
MKLHRSDGAAVVFTGYGPGYLAVNGERHACSLIVSARAVSAWRIAGFEALTAGDFEALLQHRPEILLLGTGATLRFPAPSLTRAVAAAGVGLEVMDTGAACRTYNVLAAEGRRVVAAVLLA